MDKQQILKIKSKLQKEIKITNEKIKEYTELCKPIAPDNSIGRISRMDAINNKSVVEAALRQANTKIEQLKIMQKKITDEDFGTCFKCKKVIQFDRLLIRPHSKHCINCAK